MVLLQSIDLFPCIMKGILQPDAVNEVSPQYHTESSPFASSMLFISS